MEEIKVCHAHVVNTIAGRELDYGYLIELNCFAMLYLYFIEVKMGQIKAGIYDAYHSKDMAAIYRKYYSHDKAPIGATHTNTKLGSLFAGLYRIELSRIDRPPKGFFDIIGELNQKLFVSMSKCIQDHGSIFVNINGGFFPNSDNTKILDRIYLNSFTFLDESKIEIIKWPNGKHWYAKIGNEDVVWQGKQKWNTKETAKKAAIKYLYERTQKDNR